VLDGTQRGVVIAPGRLAEVRSFDDLLVFLTEDLDWPIGNLDLEDAAFDYEPEELGIDPGRAPRLAKISELRPLTANQPWGIFFLEFAGQRLPIGELRRVLDRLITKKRRSGGDGTLRSWALHDLLFLVTTDSGDNVELHLVAFRNVGDPTPEIRSLPWRPDLSPHQHLTRMETELLPLLAWPDDPSDSEAWREQWNEAFKLRHGVAITTATQLATRMANVAQHLRGLIDSALEAEGGHGPFSVLLKEVREELVGDVNHFAFADMCAQTLVYGVLTARVTDPSSFGASPLLSAVPLTNPFLAAFFEQVHDQVLAVDLDVEGLESLVADLRDSQIEAVLDQFGAGGSHADPVIHFYEEFLKQYDSSKRMEAGAFYTPQPVVRFMVRSVNEILKTRFGLADGVADASTWGEVADRNGFDLPSKTDPNSAFISMIDPATGTGTYLIEWMRQAHKSFTTNHPESEWPDHLAEHVLPSMRGFELMLGPYAIAHLKLALETHRFDISMDPNTVLLTDTLDHPSDAMRFETMADALAAEGDRASRIKTDERLTVCIGNPPYYRDSRSQPNQTGLRHGGLIRHGVVGVNRGVPLLEDYIDPLRAEGEARRAQVIYNDYVYFWRWATWRLTEFQDGPAVVAFISASSFLNSPAFGGLRATLRDRFDHVQVVDLGGDGRSAESDENVFEIRSPVAITICWRLGTDSAEEAPVAYRKITGTADEKLAALATVSLADDSEPGWVTTAMSGTKSFLPQGPKPDGHSVFEIFPWQGNGAQYYRTWPISESSETLSKRWTALLSADPSERRELFKETAGKKISAEYKNLLDDGRAQSLASLPTDGSPPPVWRYLARSHDRQWAFADSRLGDRLRPPIWRQHSDNQLYLLTIRATSLGTGPGLMASPYVPDVHAFNGRGDKSLMPLYLDGSSSRSNVNESVLEQWSDALGEDVSHCAAVCYAYGIAGSPIYFNHFEDRVRQSPTLLPLTTDPDLFAATCALGNELIWLHTWRERALMSSPTGYDDDVEFEIVSEPDGLISEFSYNPDLQVLEVGNGRIAGISPDLWEYQVSGLKVLKSWLGYRKTPRSGKRSSPLDDVRDAEWSHTSELLELLKILQSTINRGPRASELISAIDAHKILLSSRD
jgi:hypothetical protein